jgi:hypothetical protein
VGRSSESPLDEDTEGMTDERRERHFRMDLRTGRILDGTPEPPVEELPDERWRYLGEIDPATGRSTVDVSKASGWRPIEGFWRW